MKIEDWEYLRSRIVCEKCGLEQPFRASPEMEILAPCEGPLGIPCDSETAVFLDTFEMYLPSAGAWYIPSIEKGLFMAEIYYDSRPDTHAHIDKVSENFE